MDAAICSGSSASAKEETGTPHYFGEPGEASAADGGFAQVDDRGADVTVVVFTGLGQKVGAIPPFEFSRTLESLGVNSILLRDPNLSWYQSPIAGWGDDLPDKARVLQRAIDRLPGRVVHFLGTSAGGFAALMFATFIHVDSVLVMGGQSFIDRRCRIYYGDRRWPRLIRQATEGVPDVLLNIEARDMLPDRTEICMLFGSKYPLDAIHVMHAKRKFPDRVTGISVEKGGHAVAPGLKKAGSLYPLLECAFTGRGGLSPSLVSEIDRRSVDNSLFTL